MIPAEIVMAPETYCPGCGDDCGPRHAVAYCPRHMPVASGTEDEKAVRFAGPSASYEEAGGASNRAWCDWLHRRVAE